MHTTEQSTPERTANPGLSLCICAFLIALSVWSVHESLAWRAEARLFPLLIAGAIGLTATGQLVRDIVGLRRWRREGDGRTLLQAIRAGLPKEAMAGLTWFLVIIGLILLLGMWVGLLIGVLALARFAFKRRVWVSVALALPSLGVLLIFDQLFQVFWPTPLVLSWF